MTDARQAFELPITVREADIDELGHVNNVVYLRWVQEAATAHWRVLTSEEERSRLLWVVIRHEIDYKRPAMLGDAIVARTWVGEADGLAFERRTEIVRVQPPHLPNSTANVGHPSVAEKLLARARTLWCPVDAKTMRPVEPGEEVRARFSTKSTAPLKPEEGLNGPPGADATAGKPFGRQ